MKALILALFLSLSANASQKPAEPLNANPLEDLSVIQNPTNPNIVDILVTVCGGQHLSFQVPLVMMKLEPNAVADAVLKKVTEFCKNKSI